MATPPLPLDTLAEALAAWRDNGRSVEKAAAQLGMNYSAYRYRLDKAKAHPALVEHGQRTGHSSEAVSHYWIKTPPKDDQPGISAFVKVPPETAEQIAERMADAVSRAIAPCEPIKPPTHLDDDFLSMIGLPDWHLLMQAWGRETGEDYDIRIAERDFKQGVSALLARARPARTCVILGMGDQFHASNDKGRVGRGEHVGQVDGRLLKAFEVAVWAFVSSIRAALEKFYIVKVRILPGNHDEHLAGMLAVAVKVAFQHEPRVAVDVDPSYWWHFEFGSSLFVATHGDNMKSRKQICGVAAHKFRRAFGRTDHHFLFTGDKHHEKTADEPGWLCVQLRAMTAADAYSAMSFLTPREISMWTFHKTRGRVATDYELLPVFADADAA